MKRKFLFSALLSLLLLGCKTPHALTSVQAEKNISIAATLPSDSGADAMIAPYKSKLEATMNSKISHTAVDLNKQGDNSNLGNLLADYTFDGAVDWAKQNNIPKIDAAVINIGGIRSTIGVGDILLKHIYEVMPFENELVIVKMRGTDMDGLFDYYLSTQKNNPVSRLNIITENGKIIKKLISGADLDPSKTYYIATSDYLALGGDNMKFFGNGELITTGVKLRDLYIEKFRQNPEITAPNDIRLQFNGKKSK